MIVVVVAVVVIIIHIKCWELFYRSNLRLRELSKITK